LTLHKSLQIIEYTHATMILALLVPVIYAVAELKDPAGTAALYGKCALVAVVVVAADQAMKHVKSLWLYLIVCVVLAACVWCITGVLPCMVQQKKYLSVEEICYCVGMLLETVFVEGLCFGDRLKEAKRKKDEDPFAAREANFLRQPSLSLVAYFVIIYISGVFLCSKALCDMAFISAIVYFFLALTYAYLKSTGKYLSLNKRTKGIPKKRLYGIHGVMLLVFGILTLIAVLPSILLAGQRKYYDIRTLFDGAGLAPFEFMYDSGGQDAAQGGMDMMELLNDGQPPREPSKVVMAFFWFLAAVCGIGLVYGVIQFIRQVFKDFRSSLDENGDKIEALKEEVLPYKEDAMYMGMRHGNGSEAERIRRKYRKIIRRHRKDMPAPYEAPAEIEELAGLREDVEMQALHKMYERVRYGKGGL